MTRPYIQIIIMLSFVCLMLAGIFLIHILSYGVQREQLQVDRDRLKNEVGYTQWLIDENP